ncbi:unnamed protein product [Caenorhabditis auriculariae]|uniref:Signal recognition particle 14 kDa protein n=1 Tax=Caenorhabditis auriculariae TaxID=2777116 RepID=A0A8S1H490_9PELO|nr:unnamed protein product [Caenorhabditis auriculariae]
MKEDLTDIRSYLQFESPVIQAQGFSQLLQLLKTGVFQSAKCRTDTFDLFFDCLYAFGPLPCSWLIESVSEFKSQDVLKSEEVFEGFLLRLSKVKNPEDVLNAVLKNCDLNSSSLLKLSKQLDEALLCRILRSNRNARTKKLALQAIFSGFLSEKSVQALIWDASDDQLPILANYFQDFSFRVEILKKYNHSGYLKGLSCDELMKADLESQFRATGLKIIRGNLIEADLLRIKSLIDSICPKKLCCEIILELSKKFPEQANSLSLYFITLFARPFFEIQKSTVLDVLHGLAHHKFALTTIVRFLCAMSQQKIAEREKIFGILADLVTSFPSILESLIPIVKDFPSTDSIDIFKAKLALISSACLASDSCDDLLSLLTSLLKNEGDKLAATIRVLIVLCREDVLEFATIKRPLAKKVLKKENEPALEAYSELLALGAVPNKEETEENNNELRDDCIQELWSLKKIPATAKKTNPGKGRLQPLGLLWEKYDPKDVMNVVQVSYLQIVEAISKMETLERKGFANFLHSWLAIDIEELPRPIYTGKMGKSTNFLPVFSKIDAWRDTLAKKFSEEPWFWKATLSLTPPIFQLYAPSNRAVSMLKLFRKLLIEVPPTTNETERRELFASWRLCLREGFNCLMEARSNDVIWTRDQLSDECRRALQESSTCLDNVVVVLALLADHIAELEGKMEDRKLSNQLAKCQKPWLISVAEYILPIAFDDHKPKSNPIFQILATRQPSSEAVARKALIFLAKIPSVVEGDLNVWAEAAGAHPLTVLELEKSLGFENSEENRINELLEQASTPDNVKKLFEALANSNKNFLTDFGKKLKKFEKVWNSAEEPPRRAIFEGFSRLALTSWRRLEEPQYLAVDELPDSSLLKTVLFSCFVKNPMHSEAVKDSIPAFFGHRRSDGRTLPPINWSIITKNLSDWQNDEISRFSVLSLACDQHVALSEILQEATSAEKFVKKIDEKSLGLLAENLTKIIGILPSQRVSSLFEDLARRESLSKALANLQNYQVVSDILRESLPALTEARQTTNILLKAIIEPAEFRYQISRQFDFWLECRDLVTMNVRQLCDLYSDEESKLGRNVLLCIFGSICIKLSDKNRMDKVLDVITSSRIAKSTNSDQSPFLAFFLTLVTSQPEAEIPIPWFGNEKSILRLMCALRSSFWDRFVNLPSMEENCEIISTFLCPYVRDDGFALGWEKIVARDFFKSLLRKFPSRMTLLTNEEFLSRLAGFYMDSRIKGSKSVYVTMKPYDGRTKAVAAGTEFGDDADISCLCRAKWGNHRISTAITAKEVNKFHTAYATLLRTNMDALEKKKKTEEEKKKTVSKA